MFSIEQSEDQLNIRFQNLIKLFLEISIEMGCCGLNGKPSGNPLDNKQNNDLSTEKRRPEQTPKQMIQTKKIALKSVQVTTTVENQRRLTQRMVKITNQEIKAEQNIEALNTTINKMQSQVNKLKARVQMNKKKIKQQCEDENIRQLEKMIIKDKRQIQRNNNQLRNYYQKREMYSRKNNLQVYNMHHDNVQIEAKQIEEDVDKLQQNNYYSLTMRKHLKRADSLFQYDDEDKEENQRAVQELHKQLQRQNIKKKRKTGQQENNSKQIEDKNKGIWNQKKPPLDTIARLIHL